MLFQTRSAMTIFALIILLIGNCKKDTSSISNADKEIHPFASITRTDSLGQVLEDDWDDWQPRTTSSAEPLSTLPAYPNPASSKIIFPMTLAADLHIDITIYDDPEHPLKILFDGDYSTGTHKLEWDIKNQSAPEFTAGFYRVKIAAFASDGAVYESYGDIQID